MKKKMCLIKISQKDAQQQRELYVPYHESDIEVSRSFALGQEISASASASDLRNLGHHKKLFALLRLTYRNLPEHLEKIFKSEYELLTELKMQVGHREKRVSLNGTEYHAPKSIAFEKMNQEEFTEFYDKIVDAVCKYVLPGTTSKELNDEIVGFM